LNAIVLRVVVGLTDTVPLEAAMSVPELSVGFVPSRV
jgi:hypothetical protein